MDQKLEFFVGYRDLSHIQGNIQMVVKLAQSENNNKVVLETKAVEFQPDIDFGQTLSIVYVFEEPQTLTIELFSDTGARKSLVGTASARVG